jgi:hypothetical protein
MPDKGGVATQAWRDCISGAAADRDGSGGLSAAEIQACAQGRIDAQLKDVKGFLPHHVTVAGNASAVLSFPEGKARTNPFNTLSDIYNSRDDRRLVSLKGAKGAFRIGKDDVDFSLTSSHGGFAYILMVGSDGKSFDMLFPNQLDADNAIAAGQTLRLPRPSWQIRAGGPAGKNHLLAIVTAAPREFASIGMQPAGPFSMIGASAAASRSLLRAAGASAYGAAMMILEEVE